MSELSAVVKRLNKIGPRTAPCGKRRVSSLDLDYASDVLAKKEREEREER